MNEEGWEYYKRLVVAQLASNERELKELKEIVIEVKEGSDAFKAQLKLVALFWPLFISIATVGVQYLIKD